MRTQQGGKYKKWKFEVGTFEVPEKRLDITPTAAESYKTERMLSHGFRHVPLFSYGDAFNQSAAGT